MRSTNARMVFQSRRPWAINHGMPRIGGRTRLTRRALIGTLGATLAAPLVARAQRTPLLSVGVVLPAGTDPAARLARLGAEIAGEMLARRGRPLALRFAAASGAEAAQRVALRLAEDGAALLVSACDNIETEAVLGIAERRAVPVLAARATGPRLTDRGARLIVRTAPSLSQLLGRGLGLLHDLNTGAGITPPRRFALLHSTDEPGLAMRQTLAALLPTMMPEHLLATIPVAPPWETADAPVMAALQTVQPEVIVFAVPPPAAAPCLNAILANGVRPYGVISFGVGGLAVPEVLALADAGEGHVTFGPWPDPRSPVTAEARSLFARHGGGPGFDLAQGELGLAVDCLLLAGEAAARTPGARGRALANALRATTLAQKMMRGPPLRFDARGQNLAMPSVALQNRAGRPRVVLPSEWAEITPAWPNTLLSRS